MVVEIRYEDIIHATESYGSTPLDICHLAFMCEPEDIQERLIIAPVWRPEIFAPFVDSIETVVEAGYKLYTLTIGGEKISYLITGIGAPNVIDAVLALPTTPCKELVFIGAVGGLDTAYQVGDIVIPDYSMCGDGACRYLTAGNLAAADCFGEKYYPDKELTERLREITKRMTAETVETVAVSWHRGQNFSTDSIMAQFLHIDEILALGATSIEMETAALFKAAALAKLKATALFLVSDNTVNKKSLLSGRSAEDFKRYREVVRAKLMPRIVLETLGV